MNFDEFAGTVQHRLELPGMGETVRAIRVTLMSLGERIPAGNAADLAAPVVPPSGLQKLRDQLPEGQDDGNWRKLFAVVDVGGGEAQEAQTGGGPQP